MALGFAKILSCDVQFHSAGVNPEQQVSAYAVKVMHESGIDISQHQPSAYNQQIHEIPDLVVCFGEKAYHFASLHFPESETSLFDVTDPWETKGTPDEILAVYRQVRDEISTIILDIWKRNFKL